MNNRALVALALCAAALVSAAARHAALPEVAWPDECIYLVGARNVVERGTLDTNFYLTYSLLRRGHPHRDVHMPGYTLALAPFVAALGPTLQAGAALNVALFCGCAILVCALARGLALDRAQAAAAALLFTVLPPFPGYLFVVYPEIVVAFALLLFLAWTAHAHGVKGAAVAGVLYAAGALFRETQLAALPVALARFSRREMLRGFAPAAVATLALAVAPMAHDRAVHPNALYPSVLEDARRSEAPVATLVSAVARNVAANVRLTAAARPWASAEDAVLLLFLALAIAAALVSLRGEAPRERRMFARAVLLSLAILTVAVLAVYVVRERGGVWGGVRVFMPWAPVLLVLAIPARPRTWRAVAMAVVLAAAFVGLDRWQVGFFNRYKGTDLEDQRRNAEYIGRYIDRYRPHRIVSRSFLYGLTHYPVEVVWSLPRDGDELAALNAAVGYEFLAIHERSPLRSVLIGNPRYARVNKDDRGAEFLIWRRLY